MMGRGRKLEREYHHAQRTRRRLRLRVNFGEFGFGAFLAGVLLFGGYLILDGMRQVPVETESDQEQAQLAAAQGIAEPLEPESARPMPVDRIPSVTEEKPADALVARDAWRPIDPADALVAREARRPIERETTQPRPADSAPVEAREPPPAAEPGGTKALAAASPPPQAPVTEAVVPAPVDADAPPEPLSPPAGEARAPREDARMLAAGEPAAPPKSQAQEPAAPEAVAEAPLAQADDHWFGRDWFQGEGKTDGEATVPALEPAPRSPVVANAQPEPQAAPTQVAEAPSEPFWSGWFGAAGGAAGDMPKPAPEAVAKPSQTAEAQPAPAPEPTQVAKAPAKPFWSDWFGGAGEAAGDTPEPAPEAAAEPSQVAKAQTAPESQPSQVAKAQFEPFWSGWFGDDGSGTQHPLSADKAPAEPASPAATAAYAEQPPAPNPDDDAFWALFGDDDATRVAAAEAEPFWQDWADAANEKLNQVVAVAAAPDAPETTVEPEPSDQQRTTIEEPADEGAAKRAATESAPATAEVAARAAKSAPAADDLPATATADAEAVAETGAGGGAPSATAEAPDGADEGEDPPAPEPVYATFAYGIDNGLPVHEVTYLKYPRLDHGMLYFYSEVDAPDATTLVHQWRHDGQVVAQQRFSVQGRGARAISYQYIPENARGVWRVYVLNEDGRAIKIGTALY